MERGYVKLWRKTLDSGLLQSPTAWQVFGWILLNATRSRRKIIVGGQVFQLEPGDYVASVASLSESLRLSTKQVRTALSLLEKLEILAIKGTNKGSVFSLVNWERYQDEWQTEGQTAGKQGASSGQTKGKPLKEQEIKKERILINTPLTPLTGDLSPRKKNTRFTPPTLEEIHAYCVERNNGIRAQEFFDFYASKGWKVGNSPMKDWKAAVRTWESREHKRVTPSGIMPRANTVAQQRQQERQIQARMLLADREQRRQEEERNAQNKRYAEDSDGTKFALPPGW